MSAIQEIAAKTLADLREHGWHQGGLVPAAGLVSYDEDGRFMPEYLDTCKTCVLGAAGRVGLGSPLLGDDVARFTDDHAAFVRALWHAAQATSPWRHEGHVWPGTPAVSGVAWWNDQGIRVFDDVVRALEAVERGEAA